MFLDIPDIIIFFGRFHPLVVHLPIGFLVMAVIIAFLSRKERFMALAPALDFVLLLGAVSAALASALGYLLSWGGDYNSESLFWHQWMGIFLTVISFLLYWIRTSKWEKIPLSFKHNSHYGFLGLLVLIAFTGHQGGNLTHGSEYLFQYAPDPLRVMAGLDPKPVPRPPVTVLDSADIFLDVVHPMIQSKCQSCHNNDKRKGELILTEYNEMMEGGEEGPSVIPGDLENSLLFQRITLPETHDDYMPAEGKEGFDEDQIALIQWWIENNAPPSLLLAGMEMEPHMVSKFERVLGINNIDDRLPDVEIAAADTIDLERARKEGFVIKKIIPGSNFLEVKLPFDGKTLLDMDIQALLPISDHIVWLDLSRGEVQNENLEVIGQFKNLSRLNLANNPISDQGIAFLRGLDEISYLNLYGTSVSDSGVETLTSFKKLKSLYVWQTQISDSGVASLKSQRPDIKVTLGFTEQQKGDSTELPDDSSPTAVGTN
jgi:uncharacterized membrane protein